MEAVGNDPDGQVSVITQKHTRQNYDSVIDYHC